MYSEITYLNIALYLSNEFLQRFLYKRWSYAGGSPGTVLSREDSIYLNKSHSSNHCQKWDKPPFLITNNFAENILKKICQQKKKGKKQSFQQHLWYITRKIGRILISLKKKKMISLVRSIFDSIVHSLSLFHPLVNLRDRPTYPEDETLVDEIL